MLQKIKLNTLVAIDWIKTHGKTNTHVAFNWAKTHGKAFTWIIIIVLGLFVLLSLRSCSITPASATPAPGSGWLFMKLAFAGLIWSTYATREKPYLAWTFAGLATLTFLVLLGKLENLVAWGVLGLPILAGIGILGYTKIDVSRMKSFLGFISGILILFWMFLLYLGNSEKIHIGFLKTLFPDDMAKIIFTVFLAIFIFAIWKRSKIFYGIAIIAFLSFIGNGVIDEMARRFPAKLVPETGGEISQGIGNLRNSVGKAMTRLSKEWDNPTPKTVTPPAQTSPQTQHEKVIPLPTKKTVVQQTTKTVQVTKPAPTVQAPAPVAKPVVEIWNVRFVRNGQLLEVNFEITRDRSSITMLVVADGTKFVGKSGGGNYYTGPAFLKDKCIGTFGVNLSDWDGEGWLIDTEKINLTLRRLS